METVFSGDSELFELLEEVDSLNRLSRINAFARLKVKLQPSFFNCEDLVEVNNRDVARLSNTPHPVYEVRGFVPAPTSRPFARSWTGTSSVWSTGQGAMSNHVTGYGTKVDSLSISAALACTVPEEEQSTFFGGVVAMTATCGCASNVLTGVERLSSLIQFFNSFSGFLYGTFPLVKPIR